MKLKELKGMKIMKKKRRKNEDQEKEKKMWTFQRREALRAVTKGRKREAAEKD